MVAGGSAAVLIRMAHAENAPSLAIAVWRMTLAGLALTPFFWRHHRPVLGRLALADKRWLALAGLATGLGFALWISSLEYTSVLLAMVMVTSSPLWVALIERFILKARLSLYVWGGLAVVGLGNLIIALSRDAEGGAQVLLGAVMALVAAMMVAIQRSIGRSLRQHMPLIPYLWGTYLVAAFALWGVALGAGVPLFSLSPPAYFWIALTAFVPQLVGQSIMNYALRYLPATVVSLLIQIETLISAVLAFVFLAEVPVWGQVVGSVVIMLGVSLAVLGGTSAPPALKEREARTAHVRLT
jgi:drug/metabolite transporter (DMT)-like permease